MSAPPRVIYMDKFSVVDCLKDIGGDWEYILKSDYDELQAQLTLEAMAKVDAQFKCDELQAKLTDAERLNKVALEAMKKAAQVTEFDYEHESAFTVCCGARFDKRGSDDQPNEHADDCYLNSAIKEIEGAMK